MRLLIDECLSLDLVAIGHTAGHEAIHVAQYGKGGFKDWQLMRVIADEGWTFVTNNAADFRAQHGRIDLHAGLIVIVPPLRIAEQCRVFAQVLRHVGDRDLTNVAIEVTIDRGETVIAEYDWPPARE